MKFTILTQYYPPEIGAPQARLSELAKHLSGSGHEVTVLTAMPNYPTGKIYPNYGGLVREETVCGIRLLRTCIYPSQSARMLPRMMNYLSFVASSSFFGTFLLDAPDFLIVESPPLFLGLAGLWLRWCKNSKLIFNVSDLWPDSAIELGMVRRNGFAARIAYRLEKLCYNRAWLITGQSIDIVYNIRQRFPRRPVFHLSNGVDTTFFTPGCRTDAARAALGHEGEFVSVYAGLHGHAQGLSQILQAARLLAADPKYRFVLIGDGPEKAGLKTAANEMGLSNVRFLDPRPQPEIPAILAAADAILVPLAGQITGAVPSKIYEAMASGRPLIVIAYGEPAKIATNCISGLTVEPSDIGGLARAVRKLSDDHKLAQTLSENGRTAAIEQFDRKRIFERFTKLLEEHSKSSTPAGSATFVSVRIPPNNC